MASYHSKQLLEKIFEKSTFLEVNCLITHTQQEKKINKFLWIGVSESPKWWQNFLGKINSVRYWYYTSYCVLFKTLAETPFSPILKPFFDNAVISGVRWNESIALLSEKQASPWRLQGLRSTRLEAFTVERAIAANPDFTVLGQLAASQQPAAPAAAGPRIPCRYPATLSSENSSIRAHFFDVVEPCPCLGAAHAETTLIGTECHHCGDVGLSSLCSRLAFFSESNPAPRALPVFSYQGPVRKKQWGRGSQRSEMSELTPAVSPRTSLSPHREFSPFLFTRPDQHPSAAANDLVSFGGNDDGEMDYSLVALDTEELQMLRSWGVLWKTLDKTNKINTILCRLNFYL